MPVPGLKPSELDATWLKQDDFFTWAEEHIVHRNVYTKPTRGELAGPLRPRTRLLGHRRLPGETMLRAITLAMA